MQGLILLALILLAAFQSGGSSSRQDPATQSPARLDGAATESPVESGEVVSSQVDTPPVRANEPKVKDKVAGTVVRVIDGDTLTLRIDKEDFVIRLAGIDAPEDGQTYSAAAKKELLKKVGSAEVNVLIRDKDKYGRLVGVVYRYGHCVNTDLVSEGHAWHFVEYESSKNLAQAEAIAKRKRIGLWAETNPLAPWDWRAKRNEEQGLHEIAIAAQVEAINKAKARESKTKAEASGRPNSTVASTKPVPPSRARNSTGGSSVAENGDVRGADNDGDGRTETVHVRGYYRKDGTYVRSHYRAKRGR